MRILGIESSCDETAIAIYDTQAGLMAHALHSQIERHRAYGGVVPELASRDHVRYLRPLLLEVLTQANCELAAIDGIAYTAGPGLIGALLTGAVFAQTLGWLWDKPCLAVHHMEAHLLAPMLEPNPPQYPFLACLVSGGHTQLISVKSLGNYELLGETVDDAVGEAFDKTAKLLGLPYPGGPILAKLAELGNPQRFNFPRPMTQKPGLDFSFSGLKTAVLTTWEQSDQSAQTKADIAASFQAAAVDTLVIKCQRALTQTQHQTLVIAGGVGANQHLRSELKKLNTQLYFPRPEFCTDNAAMVAYTGWAHLSAGHPPNSSIQVNPRWVL